LDETLSLLPARDYPILDSLCGWNSAFAQIAPSGDAAAFSGSPATNYGNVASNQNGEILTVKHRLLAPTIKKLEERLDALETLLEGNGSSK
jgi:hypothetical protein